jgi:hypothetical protein
MASPWSLDGNGAERTERRWAPVARGVHATWAPPIVATGSLLCVGRQNGDFEE